MPHDVFISYSSIDKAAAFAACATFESNAIRCWIAPRDVAAGSEWAEQIIDAIAAAKVMVLIFSANSNESRQVRREIELAINRGLTVRPIRLEQIEPTRSMAYYMAGVHWLDALTPPLETHFRKMVDWIKPQLGPQQESPKSKAKREEAPPKPKAEPPRAETKPSAPEARPRRKSSGIFGDLMFEFFGVGAKQGGIRINESAKAIGAAQALVTAGKPNDAIAAYRALIERIEDANVPNLDWNLSIALLNLSITYANAGRTEEALATYRTLERSCGDIADQLVEKQLAMGMNNHGNLLMDLGRPAEAIPLQDAVIERYADTINTELAQQLAIARLNRGVALGALSRNEAAVIAYDEMIAGTNLRVWPKLDDYVAMALVNKSMKLAALGRTDQALSTYDEAVSRFGSSSENAKRQQVANALCNKANLLIDLKRYDEAVAACDKGLAIPRSTESLIRTAALTMRNKVAAYRAAKRKTEGVAAADKMLAEFGGMADKTISEHVAVVRQLRAAFQ